MEGRKKYKIGDLIGSGRYGEVYMATDDSDKKSEEKYAIKIVKLTDAKSGIPATLIREICFLKLLHHINIVPLFDVIHGKNSISLVQKYIDNDLKVIISKTQGRGIHPIKVKSLLYQFLKGMNFIHSKKIMHRDIKPSNILITNDNILKICDFGLAMGYGLPMDEFDSNKVTMGYRAPDVLLGNKNYDISIDIWSIGCIFGEMVKGSPIFNLKIKEKDMLQQIFYIRGTPNKNVYPNIEHLPGWKKYKDEFLIYPEKNMKDILPKLDDDGIDLLLKMLQIDPKKRISCNEALKHKYFHDIEPKIKEMYINYCDDEEDEEDDDDEDDDEDGLRYNN